jgi:DNA-binding PadR family transcriptional regulator
LVKSTPQKQTLILWALLAKDGSAAFQNELKPEPKKADREALKREGLINYEPRGRYRRIWIEVTEKGWSWAGEHLDHTLPTGSPAGSAILRAWLTRLKSFMCAHNVSLAELLGPQREHREDPTRQSHGIAAFDYQELQARIREAYFAVTGGRANTRALLREIRQQLMNVDRAVLDEALKRMQREDSISLYPLDNKAEISDADRNAAIYFGSEPRHLLWIQL